MKKIIFSIITSCTLFLGAYAQNSKLIKSAHAFYTVSIPGMARKDDNGNIINPKPIINRMIYLESKERPVIESVSYNGIAFLFSIGSKDSTAVNVGITMNGSPIVLKPNRNVYIWKIDLVKKTDTDNIPENSTNIYLKGKIGKNRFTYLLKKEVQLRIPDMP